MRKFLRGVVIAFVFVLILAVMMGLFFLFCGWLAAITDTKNGSSATKTSLTDVAKDEECVSFLVFFYNWKLIHISIK